MNKNINRFPRLVYAPNIPALYGQGLDDYEILVKVAKTVNEIIDNVNSWNEIFEKIVTDFEGVVDEKVMEYLKELYETGGLREMVKSIIGEQLDGTFPKYGVLNFGRVWRKNYTARFTPQMNDNQFHKYFLQGCHVFNRQGDLSMVANFTGTVNSKPTDDVNMGEYRNLIQCVTYKENGLIENSAPERFPFGHGNGVTYNPDDDYCYCVAGQHYVGNIKTEDYNIYRFKPDYSEIAPGVYFESKDIQNHDKGSADICYYNHKLYIREFKHVGSFGMTWDIVAIDWQTGTVDYNDTRSITIPSLCDVFNFDIQNDMIFCVSSETREIFVFDFESGDFLWTYKYPAFDYTGQYKIKEVEGISVHANGDIYLMTCGYLGDSNLAQNMIIEVFKANYLNNVNPSDWEHGINPMNNTRAYKIYVVPSKTGIFAPTGSLENPFTDLNEAVQFINDNPFLNSGNIRLCMQEGDGYADMFKYQLCTTTYKSISIDGFYLPTSGAGRYPQNLDETPVIGGAYISDCPNFSITYVRMFNSTINMINSSLKTLTDNTQKLTRGVLHIYNSTLHLFDVYIVAPAESSVRYFYPAPTDSETIGDIKTISAYIDGMSNLFFSPNGERSNIGIADTARGSTSGQPPQNTILKVNGVSNFIQETTNKVMALSGANTYVAITQFAD